MHDQTGLRSPRTRRLALLVGFAVGTHGSQAWAGSAPKPLPPAAYRFEVVAPNKGKVLLVNFWATWCEPCREEMPDLIRFFRDHRGNGLRLVLVSADDEEDRDKVARVLAEAGLPADALSFIKRGDDMKFIDGLDRHWSGALPASFLFDGRGRKRHTWAGAVTYRALALGTAGLLRREPSPGRRRP